LRSILGPLEALGHRVENIEEQQLFSRETQLVANGRLFALYNLE